MLVTPYAGVWIEIILDKSVPDPKKSLPTRECGLKYYYHVHNYYRHDVTPYAGVWIEICLVFRIIRRHCVTPYAGVWIEMFMAGVLAGDVDVTPYAGVWIEI